MANQKGRKVLRIRPAREHDVHDLVILEEECFDTYYYRRHKFDATKFYGYLQGKRLILLVAVLNSRLIGYVAGSVRTSQAELVAFLDSIAVSPGAREKGIGSRLLRHFLEQAKRQACKKVSLEVALANNNGILFFSRREFRKICNLPEFYGKGLDGILMEFDISTTKD
jgi:ribosomal protein S18 acetylase RimI-like enzyme